MTLCPNKGMTSSDLVLRQWFPADFPYYCPFKIQLSTIVSPSNFWIQFDGPEYIGELSKLETRMTAYYNRYKHISLFPDIESIQNTRYGVIEYADGYRRVTISNMHTAETRIMATVFHCDHGLLTCVDIKKLYTLNSRFAYFPQQAIWACLSYINPVDGSKRWPTDVCMKFAHALRHKNIQAKVTGFTKDRLKVHLILEDITYFPNEVNINDKLVNLGMAIPGPTMIYDE